MRVFLSFFRLYALVSLWVRTPALLQKAASHNEGRPKKGGGFRRTLGGDGGGDKGGVVFVCFANNNALTTTTTTTTLRFRSKNVVREPPRELRPERIPRRRVGKLENVPEVCGAGGRRDAERTRARNGRRNDLESEGKRGKSRGRSESDGGEDDEDGRGGEENTTTEDVTGQDLYRGKDASTGTRANRHKRRLFYDADFVDVFCGERRPQRVKARLENVRYIERVWMTTTTTTTTLYFGRRLWTAGRRAS